MSVYFTADLHLGHVAIIKHCARPFADVDEMGEALIANWNEVVGIKDTVYVLGDFAWTGVKADSVDAYLGQLAGRKVLIAGNHDSSKAQRAIGWSAVHDLLYLRHEGERITLCHYPMRTWRGSGQGSWHLHGHSHGNTPRLGRSLDVGVDCWNYKPVSFARVRSAMRHLTAHTVDHHVPGGVF